MSKSEEIQARAARYNRVERVEDAYGRAIGVKTLKPSQRMRVEEMAPNLTGDVEVEDSEGKTFSVPRIARLVWAASVCEIDSNPVPFPKSRAELDATVDMLDEAGMAAAAEGFVKLMMGDKDAADGTAKDTAKNSPPTPASDSAAG